MGASGGAGGDDGAVKAGLGDNVDLDGRVTLERVSREAPWWEMRCWCTTYPRVVDGAGVDFGDGHGEGLLLGESIGVLGSRRRAGQEI